MIGLNPDRYYRWRRRYQQCGDIGLEDKCSTAHVVAHKLLPEERDKILECARREDYAALRHRKLAYRLQDDGEVFVSPSTVYRVLKAEGLIETWELPEPTPATGEVEVTRPNQVWHTDITYIPVGDSHCYLISVLDGYSRYVVAHELCRSMTARDVERVVAQALESAGISKDAKNAPALISDNGVQLKAYRFQCLLKRFGVEHRRIAIGHPESNGKIEVFHKTAKYECVYLKERYSNSLAAAHDIDQFIQTYNTERLHQGIDFVTPEQRYTGKDLAILAKRQRRHSAAINRRKQINQHRVSNTGNGVAA